MVPAFTSCGVRFCTWPGWTSNHSFFEHLETRNIFFEPIAMELSSQQKQVVRHCVKTKIWTITNSVIVFHCRKKKHSLKEWCRILMLIFFCSRGQYNQHHIDDNNTTNMKQNKLKSWSLTCEERWRRLSLRLFVRAFALQTFFGVKLFWSLKLLLKHVMHLLFLSFKLSFFFFFFN